MHPKERPVPVLGPLGQPEPQSPSDSIQRDATKCLLWEIPKKEQISAFW